MTDLKTLKELVKLMVSNDLTELDLQDPKGERVSLKRGTPGIAPGSVQGQPQVQYVPAPVQQTAATGGHQAPPASSASADADAGLVAIKSPMVGTYYSAPSPDAKPFVSAGAKVTAETVVCIIEAMKVFNEIKAEMGGTVEKVLVETGQAVEFGQTLFLVRV